jgi:hypothetical protein
MNTSKIYLEMDCYLLAHSGEKLYLFNLLSSLIDSIDTTAKIILEYNLVRFLFYENNYKQYVCNIFHAVIRNNQFSHEDRFDVISNIAAYNACNDDSYQARESLCKAVEVIYKRLGINIS